MEGTANEEAGPMTATTKVSIHGANATLKALKDIDPEAGKAMEKALKAVAEPIKTRAQDLVPDVPLTKWYQYGWGQGRLDWFKGGVVSGIAVQLRAPRSRGSSTSALVAVVNRNAAGAVYELAGKVNTGNRLDKGLEASGQGGASRLIWKAWDDLRGETQAEKKIEELMKQVERQAQAAIDRAGGTP